MGSGSSSSEKSSKSDVKMPEKTEPPKQKRPRRQRQQFEEVEFRDPNARPANGGPGQSGYTRGAVPLLSNSYPQQQPHGGFNNHTNGYAGHGYTNPRDMWHYAGNTVQTQQRVVNALAPQQNQDPDEFVAMALQLQEMGDDNIVFETFHHRGGRQYTCIRQGGSRFYLDNWNTHEWQAFPSHWTNQGYFVIDGDPLADNTPSQRTSGPSTSSRPTEQSDVDDRAGSIKHPTRGPILTYVFEEKRNIHCFFDEESGMWVKMPVSWEQHSDFVKPLVKQVQEQAPAWKDKYDIVAALRQSNYDPDDTITTYFSVDDKGVMDTPDRLAGFNTKLIKEKDNKIAQLQDKCSKLQKNFEKAAQMGKKLQSENSKLKAELAKLREQVSTLEVEAKTANMKVVSLQQERPKTSLSLTRQVTVIQRAPTNLKDKKAVAAPPQPQPEGPVVDLETLKKVSQSARELDKAQLILKKDVHQSFKDMKEMISQVVSSVKQMKSADSSTSQELEDLKVLYKKECLQRKLLYNKLQELRGNIRVFCRVRYDNRSKCFHQFPSDQDIMTTNPAGKKMTFQFDRVFTPESTQEQVFKEALPIITSCVDGYNVCIMAYGQTGSGKTYTMMGPKSDPGVNVRAIRELLRVCSEREQITYTLKVSMLEVYNEHLQDLLTTEGKSGLDIKMQGKKLFLEGITEVEVNQEEDITRIMDMGDANRSVAATKMNSTSSRSHLLLMLIVEGVDKMSKANSYGSLTLVDLAGSERIAKTGATGQTLVEAAAINKSLTSLGQVFNGLRTSALHVPYRNSKLTHLLQPSLGGDAKACLFVNISPDESNITESISTLQFGSNAKQVALGQATKNVSKKK